MRVDPENLTELERGTYRAAGPTPNGGAYSLAYFTDAEGVAVPKEQATRVEIQELSAEGVCLFRTYGDLPRES